LLSFVPVNFSQIARLFEQVIDLDTFVVTASPMAAGGSFSRGTHNDFTSVAARRARRLIVEMNRNIPRVFGQSQIHDRDDLRLLHRHRHPPPRMTFTTELTGAPKDRQPARLLRLEAAALEVSDQTTDLERQQARRPERQRLPLCPGDAALSRRPTSGSAPPLAAFTLAASTRTAVSATSTRLPVLVLCEHAEHRR
jgi:Acetyl-CoA hydrolase/transferase N-terminal domain